MRKTYFILLLSLACCSCKKWLDVTPQTNITDQDLFKTEEGFEEALNGIYLKCSTNTLYGGELTMGFPDVLAQNYLMRSSDPQRYLQTSRYQYATDADFISRKDNVWGGLYTAILNCNMILANIDQQKKLFTDNHYAIIKGEALALRGYLHLDLLRLFAPAVTSNAAAKSIPYVTTYSNKITPLSTGAEIMQKVTADLNSAKTLLAVDSIRQPGYVTGYPYSDTSTELSAKNLFMQNRRHHLNYYAVCGALARAYLYMGNTTDALKNADEVISANKFPWTDPADFNNVDPRMKDHILYPELLFAWYIPNETGDLQARFTNGNASLDMSASGGAFIYETGSVGGEDMRFKQWFQSTPSDAGTSLELQKYVRNLYAPTTDLQANRHPLVAPALRLSEMYYIAAECSFATDPGKAMQYFNTIRSHRGIIAQLNTTEKATFTSELIKEARKEWFGEGQIFYMYKRLNQSILAQSGSVVTASDKIFVLPLPVNEIEFGGR